MSVRATSEQPPAIHGTFRRERAQMRGKMAEIRSASVLRRQRPEVRILSGAPQSQQLSTRSEHLKTGAVRVMSGSRAFVPDSFTRAHHSPTAIKGE